MNEPSKAETLKDIALELLDKYEDSEDNVIHEYSGDTASDTEALEKEVEEYRQRIEAASK